MNKNSERKKKNKYQYIITIISIVVIGFSLMQISRTSASPQFATVPNLPCSVTAFSQRNPAYAGTLHTALCLNPSATMAGQGCIITSLAMMLKYYGVDTDPRILDDGLGTAGCPLSSHWADVPPSGSGVTYIGISSGNQKWIDMENDLAAGKPVIAHFYSSTAGHHYVLVISGSGSQLSNYTTINPSTGTTQSMQYYIDLGRGYSFMGIIRYSGTPYCQQDNTPPATTPSLSSTTGEDNWHISNVTVTLTATDNSGGTGVKEIQHKIDGGSWQTYNGASTSFSVSGDGNHTITYKAVDNAGNTESQKTTYFKIDTVTPSGSFTINSGASTTNTTQVVINSTATDATSGVASMRIRNAGETWGDWQGYRQNTLHLLPATTGQTYTVEVQYKDWAGHISSTASQSIELDIYPTRPSSTNYALLRSTVGDSVWNHLSTSYVLKGTSGQPSPAGSMSSTNYNVTSGYWSGRDVTRDLTAPNVLSIAKSNSSPTSASSINFTVTFSEPVTGSDRNDFTLSATGSISGTSVSNLTGSGDTYTATVNTGTGNGTIRLDLKSSGTNIQDIAGNPISGGYTNGETYTVDKIAPDTNIDSKPATVTSSTTATFEFSSPDNTATFECRLDSGGYTSCASPKAYTGLGDGEHAFNVRSIDEAGNIDTSPANFTWNIDGNVPNVSSILRKDTNPTHATSIDFTVTFSEIVTGVNMSDFSLTTTDISNALITSVNGSDSIYTVTVNTGTGSGTIRLDLTDNDSIVDSAGNTLGGIGQGNGTYTSGEVYDIEKSNDFFEFAKDITALSFSDDIPTNTATVAGDDPEIGACDIVGKGYATVWYKHESNSNSALSIDTYEANYDTFIAVWTGTRGSLDLVACNDDANGSKQSALAFQTKPNTTYYIEIGQP